MIKSLKTLIAALGTALMIFSGCTDAPASESSETALSDPFITEAISPAVRNLPVQYFEQVFFTMHISSADVYDFDGEILCGTVPHHLTGGQLIAGFLKTAAASRQQTDTVVITATMHFTEDSAFTTSRLDWNTPFGVLECDTEITDRIISETGAVMDDDMAALDHSVSALIPYVKYYFPESKVAFLLVDNRAERDTPEKLAGLLNDISAEKNCLFLFSADFSHYLRPEETDRRDAETLEAVMSRDYEKIASMSDSNVDSPHVLGTFLRLAEYSGREVSLLGHSNSLLISGKVYNEAAFSDGLTSYYVFSA